MSISVVKLLYNLAYLIFYGVKCILYQTQIFESVPENFLIWLVWYKIEVEVIIDLGDSHKQRHVLLDLLRSIHAV